MSKYEMFDVKFEHLGKLAVGCIIRLISRERDIYISSESSERVVQANKIDHCGG